MTNIFVGNLNYSSTQDDLHATLSQFGNVERVNLVTDRVYGEFIRSRSDRSFVQSSTMGPPTVRVEA